MQLFAYKQAAGQSGIACFLVDRGVAGLKDAWTRVGIDREEFKDMLRACEACELPMHRTDVAEVRRWVAGGARWAYDNGMRLPREWIKATILIGGAEIQAGEAESPD